MLLYTKLAEKIFEKSNHVKADEFRHIAGGHFHVKSKGTNEWWMLAKELEQHGYLIMHKTKHGFTFEKKPSRL